MARKKKSPLPKLNPDTAVPDALHGLMQVSRIPDTEEFAREVTDWALPLAKGETPDAHYQQAREALFDNVAHAYHSSLTYGFSRDRFAKAIRESLSLVAADDETGRLLTDIQVQDLTLRIGTFIKDLRPDFCDLQNSVQQQAAVWMEAHIGNITRPMPAEEILADVFPQADAPARRRMADKIDDLLETMLPADALQETAQEKHWNAPYDIARVARMQMQNRLIALLEIQDHAPTQQESRNLVRALCAESDVGKKRGYAIDADELRALGNQWQNIAQLHKLMGKAAQREMPQLEIAAAKEEPKKSPTTEPVKAEPIQRVIPDQKTGEKSKSTALPKSADTKAPARVLKSRSYDTPEKVAKHEDAELNAATEQLKKALKTLNHQSSVAAGKAWKAYVGWHAGMVSHAQERWNNIDWEKVQAQKQALKAKGKEWQKEAVHSVKTYTKYYALAAGTMVGSQFMPDRKNLDVETHQVDAKKDDPGKEKKPKPEYLREKNEPALHTAPTHSRVHDLALPTVSTGLPRDKHAYMDFATVEKTIATANKIHGKPGDPARDKAVGKLFAHWIERMEHFEQKAYPDSRGLITIGIGFNMERNGARKFFDGVLGKGMYDACRYHHRALSYAQGEKLMIADAKACKISAIQVIGKKAYQALTPPEEIAVLSLVYNGGGGLIDGKLGKELREHDREGVTEIIKNSLNKRKTPGIWLRRLAEACLYYGDAHLQYKPGVAQEMFHRNISHVERIKGRPMVLQTTLEDHEAMVKQLAQRIPKLETIVLENPENGATVLLEKQKDKSWAARMVDADSLKQQYDAAQPPRATER